MLDAYFIVFAALMVPGGRWADQFGSRNVFAIGVSTFIQSSVGCAVAPTLGALVAARAAQAVGAALMGPASLALILPYFGRGSRATAVSLWGTSAALAAALGPPLGGFLADTVGWRGIFLINVPIGLAVLAGLRNVDNRGDAVAGQLVNTSAIVLIASGVGALTAGILEGPSWGWGQPQDTAVADCGCHPAGRGDGGGGTPPPPRGADTRFRQGPFLRRQCGDRDLRGRLLWVVTCRRVLGLTPIG